MIAAMLRSGGRWTAAETAALLPEPRVPAFCARLLDPALPLRWIWARHLRVRRGWRLHDRVLAEHIVYLVDGGSLAGAIAGERVELGPGDVFFVAAGVRHQLGPLAEARPELHLVRFGLDAPPPWPWLLLRRAALLRPGFAALVAQSGRQPLVELRRRTLLADLVAAMEQARLRAEGGLTPAQVAALESALRERQRAPQLGGAALARACGLSPAWFARRFRVTFGEAPRSWLARRRIEAAAAVLAAGGGIAAAMAAAGYADRGAFHRAFRRNAGLTPGEQRRTAER